MSKRKHRYRHEEEVEDHIFNPNMLAILVIVLSYFSNQEPSYGFREDLINIQHNGTTRNGVNKVSDPGYTGGSVLNKEYDSQDKAGIGDNIDYTGVGPNVSEIIQYEEDSFEDKVKNNTQNIYYIEDNFRESGMLQHEADMNGVTLKSPIDSHCDSVIESEVIPEYPSSIIMPKEDCNKIIINAPIILTQFEVEFTSEAIITLDQPALDIKRIKKKVFLDQCRLLLKANKLFISGIIRNNIEYDTEDKIRHATVEVPFRCATEVKFFTLPVVRTDCEMLEVETLRPDGMGTDLSERTFISKEYLNEKIFCRLISDEVKELDTFDEDNKENKNLECDKYSKTVTEKLVVRLKIKLVQEQEISINKN